MTERLYVACRTFKTQGKLITAGDVFTETELNQFKYRNILLSERRFKEVPRTEQELKELQDYFTVRWGTDFAEKLAARVSKGSSTAEPVKPSASATPTTPGTGQTAAAKGAAKPLTGKVSGKVSGNTTTKPRG